MTQNFVIMSYPGRPPIMQGLPMAYMPMGAPPPQLMPAVMPIQHVSVIILLSRLNIVLECSVDLNKNVTYQLSCNN